jgi:hypothetical protein
MQLQRIIALKFMSAHNHYLLYTVLCAVELRETQDGPRMGALARIPPGSSLEIFSSPANGDGMVAVGWHGRRYAVFLEDLKDRGELEEDDSQAPPS